MAKDLPDSSISNMINMRLMTFNDKKYVKNFPKIFKNNAKSKR